MDTKKKKKKMPTWAMVLLIIVLFFVAVALAGYIYVQSKLDRINKVDPETVSYVDPANEDFETEADSTDEDTILPEDITWDDVDITVMQDENIKNILLIGQDARPGEGRARSDSMIICSLNTKTGKITLASVMRDLYVPIPGYSDNRINAAYQFGGMQLLDQVMEESLGIHIDGNVEVNFEGFIGAISQVGNLDIELKEVEANYLNKGYGWNLTAGMNSLTPEQALAYARTRHVGNADWERTDRQRRVIMTAFAKVKDEGVKSLLTMTENILPYLTTDLSNNEILGYVYTVATKGMTIGNDYRIPVDGTYSCETLRKGMEVLVPDLNANSALLQGYLYGDNQ